MAFIASAKCCSGRLQLKCFQALSHKLCLLMMLIMASSTHNGSNDRFEARVVESVKGSASVADNASAAKCFATAAFMGHLQWSHQTSVQRLRESGHASSHITKNKVRQGRFDGFAELDRAMCGGRNRV
eukprot:5573180-Amphidinium_carterae.1